MEQYLAYWLAEVHFSQFEAAFHVGASLDLVLVWLVEVGKLAGRDIIRAMNAWRDERIAALGELSSDHLSKLKSNVETRKRKALGKLEFVGRWAKWVCGLSALLGVYFLLWTSFNHDASATRLLMFFNVLSVLAPMPISLLILQLVGRRQLRKLKAQNKDQEEGMTLVPKSETLALKEAQEEIESLRRQLEAAGVDAPG